MTNRFTHPSHLSVATFVDGDSQARLRRAPMPPAEHVDGCRGCDAVRQLHAAAQLADGAGGWRAGDDDFVRLVDFETRVGEAIGELTVVGEQEDTGRVSIESTDRHCAVSES